MTKTPLPPGSMIGIFGGGQLGRMAALAAGKLGYCVHIFDPEVGCPAAQVAALHTAASYDDMNAIKKFADTINIATFEFENIPSNTLTALEGKVPVRPNGAVLHTVQDRLREKDFLNELGITTTAYACITSPDELASQLKAIGLPAVLKGARLGYDGKGQQLIEAAADVEPVWRALKAERAILESWVDFVCEISVIVSRGLDGTLASYAPSENIHSNHILRETRVPASITPEIGRNAQAIAEKIADALSLIGLLAVEFFVTKKGTLLVNEIAPRPHNSGHWTIDACITSQFEQFIRAITGLSLGTTEHHSNAVMVNLLGSEVTEWQTLAAEPGASVHLYGKKEVRPGRKMGHVTRLTVKR